MSDFTLPSRLRYAVGGVVVLLFGVMALGAETQYVANALHYARALGEPIVRYEGTPIYAPWAVFTWRAASWATQRRALFETAEVIRWGVLVASGVIFVGGLVRRRAAAVNAGASAVHGSARWATKGDLKKAGMLSESGLVLAQTCDAKVRVSIDPKTGKESMRLERAGQLLRDPTGVHTLMFAPSGSGKGVGAVCPTLLGVTNQSVLTWDLKRELWQTTAGWRSQFSKCICFDPSSRSSHRFNPLLEVRLGTDNETRDAQSIAEMLADPEGKSAKGGGNDVSEHFRTIAQSFFTGLILHVLYAENDKSLPRMSQLLADPNRKIHDLLETMKTTRHLQGAPHPVVAAAAAEAAQKTQTELSGLISTALSSLGLYRDPIVADAVRESDFQIADLMHRRRPSTLYMVSPLSDQQRLRPAMRLVLNQIGRRLTEENPSGGGTPYKFPLLFLLDEFPTLGNMPLFSDVILPAGRGYGLKAFLICQDLVQLEDKYGANNSIISNCDRRITYHANDDRTADRIVKFLGQATITKQTRSVSGEAGAFMGKKTVSESTQEHARALLTSSEVMQLPRDEVLVFAPGIPPYRGKKVVYYDDPRFKTRANMPPPAIRRA